MPAEDDLLAAVMGSREPYRSMSLVDRLDAALDVAWTLSAGLDLSVPAYVEQPAGPFHSPPKNALEAALDQVAARWPGAAKRPRTLTEKAALLEALVSGVARARTSATSPPTSGGSTPSTRPAGGPSAGWRSLPAPTEKLRESDRSSYQHTAPRWNDAGMTIAMPARGQDDTAVNPDRGASYQRCEITVAGQGGVRGGRRCYRLVYDLAQGFPVDADDWQVLAQWKGDDTGSPPLSLEVRNGMWMLTWHRLPTTPVGKPVPIGPARAGARADIVVDVSFSADRDGSPVSAWLNGTKTVDAAKVSPTLYAGKADRLKVGLYRSASIGKAATLTLAGLAVGADLAAVTA